MSWAYAYAINKGADHERCDDVAICETLGDVVVAAVADGAGSACKGRQGASIVCQTFLELAVAVFNRQIEPSCIVGAVQSRIPEAERLDHSCTLVGAIVGPRGSVFLQVGDGAAVYAKKGEDYRTAIIPEKSEFLNQTYFVSAPNAEEHLQVKWIEEPIERVALFTDGLQHLVIDLKDDSPHQPFFGKIFETLAEKPGFDTRTSWWLERTLASESVTRRTDDDTSIVVARSVSC